jgi:hypothetical protein
MQRPSGLGDGRLRRICVHLRLIFYSCPFAVKSFALLCGYKDFATTQLDKLELKPWNLSIICRC